MSKDLSPLHSPTNPLIVALDVSSEKKALELVALLKDHAAYFKIGLQLFTATGPDLLSKILNLQTNIFLDLKFHDIPNTVASAAVEAARLGVHMLTVHTLGGEAMMRQTRKILTECSRRENWNIPRLLGVTILTSIDEPTLHSLGIHSSMDEQVLRLAKSALEAGLDGIVCSPWELQLLNSEGFPEDFLLVTPGIRPGKAPAEDQARTMSPSQALASGADYLVIGRPIVQAADPLGSAVQILEEISGS